jgi:hypothetical protein
LETFAVFRHPRLDVLEDHLAEKARDPQFELCCVSYDLSKKYDSVQGYSFLASLERFELLSDIVDSVSPRYMLKYQR